MNSANSKSRAFANGSPWSDTRTAPRSTPSRKPPRSPPRKLVYHDNTVNSPAFDFSSTKASPKRSNRKGGQASKSPGASKADTSLKLKSSTPPEAREPAPTARSKDANVIVEAQRKTRVEEETSDIPTLSMPANSKHSPGSDCDNKTTLSASTPVFVPSQITLAALHSPKSVKSSVVHSVGGPGSHSRTRPRLPTGDELKQMVKVLLDIIDKSANTNDDSSPKKAFHPLCLHLLPTKVKSRPLQGRTNHGTPNTFSRVRAGLASPRRRTHSA